MPLRKRYSQLVGGLNPVEFVRGMLGFFPDRKQEMCAARSGSGADC